MFPTLLALASVPLPVGPSSPVLDGIDVSPVFLQSGGGVPDRWLFHWQTGNRDPESKRPVLYALRWGQALKAHFWTRSGKGPDLPVKHDPPLIFDVLKDPAEKFPLARNRTLELIFERKYTEHEGSIEWTSGTTVGEDPALWPCIDRGRACRSIPPPPSCIESGWCKPWDADLAPAEQPRAV